MEYLALKIKKFIDLRSFITLDTRSLALMRIALGLVLIYDTCNYWNLADFFFSDNGFLPLKTFLEHEANPWTWSLLFINGSSWFLKLFLTWHLLTIIFFIIGYNTRLNTFLLWLQIVSIHNRNWAILNGGDDLVRCCLIILIFLPLGSRCSIDAINSKRRAKDLTTSHTSFINIAFFMQIFIMYYASAIFKNHPIWNQDYSALYYALQLDLFSRELGQWLKPHYKILQVLTAGAYYFELYGGFIILLGLFKNLYTLSRYLIVISFITFHLLIDQLLDIGVFPFYAIALWTAFLPSNFWNNTYNTYNTIKQNSAIWKPQKLFTKSIQLMFATFLITNLLFWPMADSDWNGWLVGHETFFRTTNRWLHTYQNWHLFAPYPKKNNVWFAIDGVNTKGEVFDLYQMKKRRSPLTAQEVQQYYKVEKWRKVFLKAETDPRYAQWLSNFYCEQASTGQLKIPGLDHLENVTVKAYFSTNYDRYMAGQREEKVLSTSSCL